MYSAKAMEGTSCTKCGKKSPIVPKKMGRIKSDAILIITWYKAISGGPRANTTAETMGEPTPMIWIHLF